MTDPREDRLPKWAQSELSVLRKNIEYMERKMEALVQPVEGAPIVLSLGPERDLAVPMETRISYRMEDDGRSVANAIQVVLREDREGRFLQLHGGRALNIRPEASNHFTLRLEPFGFGFGR